MIRFTKALIQKVLEMNEGFIDRTYHKSRNSEEENHYSLKTENYLSVLLEKHRGQIAVTTKQPFVMKIKPDDYANAKTG